jgi:hypothetical protein
MGVLVQSHHCVEGLEGSTLLLQDSALAIQHPHNFAQRVLTPNTVVLVWIRKWRLLRTSFFVFLKQLPTLELPQACCTPVDKIWTCKMAKIENRNWGNSPVLHFFWWFRMEFLLFWL